MSDAKPDQDFRNSNLSAPLDFEATYGDSLSDTDPVNVRLSYWPSGYRFGRYQIVRPIGGGTSAIVYLALDEKLGREVALKVARQQAGRSLDTGERFRREAQSVAKLEHPNLCAVFESGEHDGHLYISMAYIEGQSLAAWIQDRVPDELEVIRVVRAVALALAEAHESGIVHRDLKPANILMNRHGDPVVTDFGLALSTNAELSARLTQPGLIVGSPAYMSPEQIRDASNVGPRSDVYSLGIVMYQMLTGTLPYTGEVMTVIRKIALEQPTPPKTHRPELSEATNAVCLQAIAKEESQRFQSMSDFAAALRQSVRTTSGKSSGKVSRNRYFAVIALGLLAATIILSLLIEPERKPTREDRSVSSGAQNTVDWDQEASMGEKMEGLQYWLDLGLRLEDENDHGIEEPILEFPTSVGGVGTLQMREIDVDELRELFQLFPDAKKLSLRADDFSDIAWKVIAEHEPRHLYIIADELMPEAFPAISEMKYLKWLELDCASVKDEDVEVLASLTQLESLLLSNTQVTGKCFPLLAGMESITNLEFADSQIQDEYLSGLKYFPNLKQVSFSNNPIDGSGLSGLAENKNLVKLDFTDTPLKDRYLESLRGLDALQSLKLKKCSDIRDLSGLEGLSLKFIDISGTNVEDIRPLTTMLIEHIYIDLTPKQDETLLRSIKSLRLINDIPIENDAAENESS